MGPDTNRTDRGRQRHKDTTPNEKIACLENMIQRYTVASSNAHTTTLIQVQIATPTDSNDNKAVDMLQGFGDVWRTARNHDDLGIKTGNERERETETESETEREKRWKNLKFETNV